MNATTIETHLPVDRMDHLAAPFSTNIPVGGANCCGDFFLAALQCLLQHDF